MSVSQDLAKLISQAEFRSLPPDVEHASSQDVSALIGLLGQAPAS